MRLSQKAEHNINSDNTDFTSPCDLIHPFRWNWDNAFYALGIFMYNKKKAINEINKIFERQLPNGMIPHIFFLPNSHTYYTYPHILESNGKPPVSCISQPPILSTIIWYMIVLGLHNKSVVHVYFNRLMYYHKWFIENRDPYNNGLISILHPWESGRDNSPDWIDALNDIHLDNSLNKDEIKQNENYNRYMQIILKNEELDWNSKEIYNNGLFNVCDPGIQFMFIRACKDLYKMAIWLERTDCYELLNQWIDIYSTNCDKLWCNQLNTYTTLNIKTIELYKGISPASMLYAYADVGTQFQRHKMLEHSKRILHFSKYSFPTHDPYSNKYQLNKYWQGPVSSILNFIVALGMAHIHESELAHNIKTHTIQLIENDGFYKYFDPLQGLGLGENESWTACIYLVFSELLM